MVLFACIFIPDFSVEAVLRAEPILRGQPVAVLEGKPPLCYVVCANEAARHLGVEIGMTKLLAETLQKANEKNEERGIKNEEPVNGKSNSFSPNRFPQDNERERTVSRRPHSQGAYQSVYGHMDPRFGLYRTRLEAEELEANHATEPTPHKQKQTEHTVRNGTVWSHDMSRQSSFVAPTSPRKKDVNAAIAKSLTLRMRASAQEESAQAALLDAAHAVSPRVEESASDTVILDVDGLERLFGTPQQVAQELVRRITEVGLVGNVAIAANPDAAEHAARGFPGVSIIPANRESDRLGTLPLEVLFASERSAVMRSTKRRDQQRKASEKFDRMQETLDRWGIRNFRGLAALPPVSLSERLGTSGVRLQLLASGGAMRELVLSEPALHFEETVELEYSVALLEPLAFLLAGMLDGLCARLSARALATNELRLRLKLEHRTADEATKSEAELEGDPIVERKISLPVPMNDARLFLKLLQLELSAAPPGAPVTQMWLEAEAARPRMGQAGLFQPLAPETQKLELTLARMHKLLGIRNRLRAGCPELVDTYQPDTFKVARFRPTEEKPTKQVHESAEKEGPVTNDAFNAFSLRRYRPPLEARVDLRDGTPARLTCAELGARDPWQDNIVWAAGPWRTSGNWWEGKRHPKNCRSGEPESKLLVTSHTPKTDRNEERRTRNEEQTKSKEPAVSEAANWNHEEWDIAVAITSKSPASSERTSQIALYRLVRDCSADQWTVEGGYD